MEHDTLTLWPEAAEGDEIGDGRYAFSTDRPETIDELRETVARRIAEGSAIYPRGGGVSLNYGGVPRSPGAAIDLRGLDRLIDYPHADMTVTAEAGMTLAKLRAILREHGQMLSVDAPRADRATLGGLFACDSFSSRRFGWGRPRDAIIGVGFVSGTGELIKGGGRVVKNVAGYDLPKLLTGSLGTLGTIAWMTLKVRPRPERSSILWVPLPNLEESAALLDRLNRSAARPTALDLLNLSAAELVGGPLGLPTSRGVLAIGLEDNASSVEWQIDRLRDEVAPLDSFVVENDAAESLWSALIEFQEEGTGTVGFLANLRPSAVPGFAALFPSERWAIQAHAGNGNVRAQALGRPSFEEVQAAIELGRHEAVAAGGNLILPRCPTDWKDRLLVWGEPRADWALAERIKKALDPAGLLNPGRFVGTI